MHRVEIHVRPENRSMVPELIMPQMRYADSKSDKKVLIGNLFSFFQ